MLYNSFVAEYIRPYKLNNFDKEHRHPELLGTVYDPLSKVRETFSPTVEHDPQDIANDISIMLNADLDSDPKNRERLDKSLLNVSNTYSIILYSTNPNENIVNVLEDIDNKIKENISTEEGRKQAGVFAELYIRTLQTYRKFEITERSRAMGDNKFNRLELLDASGDHWDACQNFVKFVQQRCSQDEYRFATPHNSDKRISSHFDKIIKLVNTSVGIQHTVSYLDGIPALSFSRISDTLNSS